MLVGVCAELDAAVVDLANVLLQEGKWPSDWQSSLLIPLLKSGKKEADPSSYRGISIGDHMSKVVAGLLERRLRSYLRNTGHAFREQFGFQPARSCMDALLVLTSSLHERISRNKQTFVAFVDFSNAFPTVWRSGLLPNLQQTGIGDSKVFRLMETHWRACTARSRTVCCSMARSQVSLSKSRG